MGTSKLGNMLVEDGLLSEADRRTIKRTCGTGGSAFARGILAMGLLDEDELAAYIAEHTSWHVASKNLLESVQSGAWGYIDRPLVEQLEVLPLKLAGDILQVAMVDPLDQDTISQLEFFSGYKILPVIATMTQVRRGLQKFLPDYKASNSQLEDFLKNHSITASKRIRMSDQSLYDDLPSPDSFSIGSIAKGSSARPGTNHSGGFEDDEDDIEEIEEIEDNIEFESDTSSAVGAILDNDEDSSGEESFELEESESVDDDNLFSIEDDSFSTSSATSAAPANSIIDSQDDIDLELDSDIDLVGDLGGDLGGDLDGDIDFDMDPNPKPAQKTEAKTQKTTAAAASDDLENLMDLNDFDPDSPGISEDLFASESDDLLSGTEESEIASAEDFSFEPGGELTASEPTIDDSLEAIGEISSSDFGDLSGDLDDLSADFSSNVTATVETAGDDDILGEDTLVLEHDDALSLLESDETSELSADFSSLGSSSSDDEISFEQLSEQVAAEESAAPSKKEKLHLIHSSDDLDLTDFDAPLADSLSGSTEDDDLLAESGLLTDADLLESLDLVTDTNLASPADLGSDLSSDLDSDLNFDEPAILDEDLDITATSTSDSLHQVIAINPTTQNVFLMINKMFFNVSMALETKDAIGAIAPDLKASGFSTGLVIGGSQESDFKAECGWLDTNDSNVPMATSASLQDKGIKAALGRLPSAWTPLDDAVRQGDLKVFASLQRDDKRLFGIKFKSAKLETVIVTAMAPEITENSDLMDMAANLFRQVAQKNKGVA